MRVRVRVSERTINIASVGVLSLVLQRGTFAAPALVLPIHLLPHTINIIEIVFTAIWKLSRQLNCSHFSQMLKQMVVNIHSLNMALQGILLPTLSILTHSDVTNKCYA